MRRCRILRKKTGEVDLTTPVFLNVFIQKKVLSFFYILWYDIYLAEIYPETSEKQVGYGMFSSCFGNLRKKISQKEISYGIQEFFYGTRRQNFDR